MFSFEAGRRCDSGPGNFTFDTKQGNEIFMLVDKAIQSQKAQAEDRNLSGPFNSDPDCPASLQHIRNAGGLTSASGDSSSCSSREADNDSGGSKPGSADGVLGKREGGDGGGGRGQGSGAAGGVKGRCLPEPPAMLGVLGGGGTPPRSPRSQPAGKGLCSADKQAGLYSEPADSVRLPLHSMDCLYSDPVDSIKSQNQSGNPSTPPVPTPRLRPLGDESSGGGIQGDHHPGGPRNPPDLYSHVYDRINLELNPKTSALSLNGAAGGGRGAGRGMKSNRRPPGGQAEGALSPPGLSLDHIYDEPEGCAKVSPSICTGSGMSIYDEARLEPSGLKRQDETVATSGLEGICNTSTSGKPLEPLRHSPPQLGPSRGTPQPPTLRPSKPVTAPKPPRSIFARKEPVPLPSGKLGGPGSNVNNNNNIWGEGVGVGGGGGGAGGKELYSIVSKHKPLPANLWYSKHQQDLLRSPDIIYDNLGDI